MKAVVYDKPQSYVITDVPMPEPGPGQVRIKVIQVGVCGTDLHIHNGEFMAAFPLTPGHELVGMVDALGDGSRSIPGRRAGDRQPERPLRPLRVLPLRPVDPVLRAQGHGLQLPGLLRRVRGGARDTWCSRWRACPLDTAVFAEPAACATHGLENLQVRPGASALVFGAGPTGLLLAQLIRSGGASSVTVAAPKQFKLDVAAGLGIDRTVRIERGADAGHDTGGGDGTRRAARATTSWWRRPGPPRSATSACP